MLVYLLFRTVLPAEGWKMLAALSATWTGARRTWSPSSRSSGCPKVLCRRCCWPMRSAIRYGCWCCSRPAAFAPSFNRWTGADRSGRDYPQLSAVAATGPADVGNILLWLGLAMLVGLGAARLATLMPTSTMLDADLVDGAVCHGRRSGRRPHAAGAHPRTGIDRLRTVGIAGGRARLRRVTSTAWRRRRSSSCAASSRCFCISAFLRVLARVFRFDLYLCGISSLAQIGGVASAPVLAATYSPVLVPIAVLLAMLGLIVGTGMGLFMASVLSSLAPVGAG